ncbi:MAG: hypothetical protein ABI882_12510 [Acidobacteriota bacterium]
MMLRNFRDRFGTTCLILAPMIALAGSGWSHAPLASSHIEKSSAMVTGPVEFAQMDVKGGASVDDANNPSKLSFDLRSSFRLGLNSNGINPFAEDLSLHLQYGSIVGPMYIVFVPAGCLTPVGKGGHVQMNDFHNCGLSIQLLNVSQSPGEILPFIELVRAVDRFDLRLTPGPKGQWDLKLSIDFLPTPNVPIAGITAVLRSPDRVKLMIGKGDTADSGDAAIRRVEFSGDN